MQQISLYEWQNGSSLGKIAEDFLKRAPHIAFRARELGDIVELEVEHAEQSIYHIPNFQELDTPTFKEVIKYAVNIMHPIDGKLSFSINNDATNDQIAKYLQVIQKDRSFAKSNVPFQELYDKEVLTMMASEEIGNSRFNATMFINK